MKNLKKVLSLALAMVMAMSLMTTAFAADYADIDDVNYTEAVEVMTAVGVFNGVGGDKFAPDATLDRASAAKLIAYLDLGAEDADALTASGTMFTDVPADYWAAGYIEYMAAAGYTNGTGHDKFSPKNTVTGLEFGKWLLTVLGYNANAEKMTGGSWGINTSKLANSIDLFEGVSAPASSNLTREAAAAYCLNALQATCVYYTDLGTDIKLSDGTTINTGASPAYDDTRDDVNENLFAGDGKLQLTEKLFGDDLQKDSTTPDAFGRPVTTWTYGSFTESYADVAEATYTNVVESKTLYNLLGKKVVDEMKHYSNTADATKDYYTTIVTNGVKDSTSSYYNIANNTSDLLFTKNGAITEVYKDANAKTVTIVVTETFVGKAAADYNENLGKLSVLNVTGCTSLVQDNPAKDIDGFEVKDFAEDDFFLYSYANGAVQNVIPAETMTGVVNGYVAGTSVTVDGTTYEYSANFYVNDGLNNNAYALGETATFVMDGMGNIIAIVEKSAAADDQYVYVENIGSESNRNPVAYGDIVNVDGTTKDGVVIKSMNGDKAVDEIISYNTGWYAYTMDGDALKLSDNVRAYYTYVTTAGQKLVTNGSLNVGLYGTTTKADTATVFIIKDEDDAITTYTGIFNVPTITATGLTEAYFVNGSDGFANYVYIDMADTATSSNATTTDNNMFYVLKQSAKKVVGTSSSDSTAYYTLDVLKDGAVKKVDVKADSGVEKGIGTGFWINAKADANGYVTAATQVTGTAQVDTYGVADAGTYYVSYSNNILTLNNDTTGAAEQTLIVADDVVIYVVLTNGVELMDDDQASYEVLTLTAKQFASILNGYRANFTNFNCFNVADDDTTVKTIYATINGITANAM